MPGSVTSVVSHGEVYRVSVKLQTEHFMNKMSEATLKNADEEIA